MYHALIDLITTATVDRYHSQTFNIYLQSEQLLLKCVKGSTYDRSQIFTETTTIRRLRKINYRHFQQTLKVTKSIKITRTEAEGEVKTPFNWFKPPPPYYFVIDVPSKGSTSDLVICVFLCFYVSPRRVGRHIRYCFSPGVRMSVCLSVTNRVRSVT